MGNSEKLFRFQKHPKDKTNICPLMEDKRDEESHIWGSKVK